MAGDIVWTLDANGDPFISSMNKVRNSAKETRDAVERQVEQIRQLRINPDAGYIATSPTGDLRNDPLAATRARDDIRIRAKMEETYRKRNIELILQEESAEKHLASAKMKTTGQMHGFTSSSQSGIRALQQLSFGVEDAATQFGTMGLSGAIRGAGNNISAAAMSFGPLASVVASLGVTALTVGTNFVDMGQNAKKSAVDIDHLSERAKNLGNELDRIRANSDLRLRQASIPEMGHKELSKEAEKTAADLEVMAEQRTKREEEYTNVYREGIRERQDAIKKELGNEWDLRSVIGARDADHVKNLKRESQELERQEQLSRAQIANLTMNVKFDQKRIDFLKEQRQEIERINAEQSRTEKLHATQQENLPLAKAREEEKKAREEQNKDIEKTTKYMEGFQQSQREEAEQEARRVEAEAKRWYEKSRTAQQTYDDKIKRIKELQQERPDIVTPSVAAQAAKMAHEEMQREMHKGVTVPVKFEMGEFVDARGKDALTGWYNALMRQKKTGFDNIAPEKPPLDLTTEQEKREQERRKEIPDVNERSLRRDLRAAEERQSDAHWRHEAVTDPDRQVNAANRLNLGENWWNSYDPGTRAQGMKESKDYGDFASRVEHNNAQRDILNPEKEAALQAEATRKLAVATERLSVLMERLTKLEENKQKTQDKNTNKEVVVSF